MCCRGAPKERTTAANFKHRGVAIATEERDKFPVADGETEALTMMINACRQSVWTLC